MKRVGSKEQEQAKAEGNPTSNSNGLLPFLFCTLSPSIAFTQLAVVP